MEAKLQANIISTKDAAYAMFKEGFDETVVQVNHFNANI